jgi:hypothetical protein
MRWRCLLLLPCLSALAAACSDATSSDDAPGAWGVAPDAGDAANATTDSSARADSSPPGADSGGSPDAPPGSSPDAAGYSGDGGTGGGGDDSGSSDSAPPATGAGDDGGTSADGGDTHDSGTDAAMRDTGAPDAGAAAPDWSTEFVANGGQWPNATSGVTFGFSDPQAEDGNVVQLLLPGAPGMGAAYNAGTGFATEIDSPVMFQYGTFRARLTLPTCDPSEDVVNGFFTFFNDGTDHDGNGIIDNSEIDMEILCGLPHVLSLTTWTDYSSDTSFNKFTRLIDFSTGAYSETVTPNSFDLQPKGTLPELLHPEFPAANTFYEMGFDWRPGELRFFLVLGGTEITLWDYTDPRQIPKLTSALLLNVWHPSTHWTGDNSPANYPAHDAVTHIDWVRYWK